MTQSSMRLSSFLVLVFLSLALVACDSGGSSMDDGTNGGDNGGNNNGAPLSVSESQSQLGNADASLSTSTSELIGGEFSTTLQGLFLTSSTSTTSSKQTVQRPLGFDLVDAIEQQALIQIDNNGRLVLSNGAYNWNGSTWSSGGSQNGLVLNFPTSRNQSSNNAALTLATYDDVAVTIDGETEYLPKTVNASLSVGGTDIFSVDLSNTAFYTEQLEGTQVPKQFDLTILTAPQQHTFSLSSPSKKEFNFGFELKRQSGAGDRVVSFQVDATFKDNFDAVSGTQGVDAVAGQVGFGPDVTVDYTVDVAGIEALGDDPSPSELNDEFTATMFYQGSKVGTLELDEEDDILLVYNDGSTKDPLADVFDQAYGSVQNSPFSAVTTAAKTAAGSIQKAVAKVFQP